VGYSNQYEQEQDMVKIYGNDASMFSNKVKLTANALGVAYEFVTMDFRAGDMSKPAYLAIHPAGKIPGMDDGGFTLFESSAIMRYLADKQGSDLYPRALQLRAQVDAWMDFSTIHIGHAVTKVVFNKIMAPAFGMPVDAQSLADGIKFYARFLPVVDAQLAKQRYVASDALSLADITLLAVLDPSEAAGLDITPYAHVVQWRTARKQEQFYTDSFTSYDDVLKAMMHGAGA
jgi:glutathione S-transferase